MNYYALLDTENIVNAVVKTRNIISVNAITLSSFDESLLGKKYVNGQFIEVETEVNNIAN